MGVANYHQGMILVGVSRRAYELYVQQKPSDKANSWIWRAGRQGDEPGKIWIIKLWRTDDPAKKIYRREEQFIAQVRQFSHDGLMQIEDVIVDNQVVVGYVMPNMPSTLRDWIDHKKDWLPWLFQSRIQDEGLKDVLDRLLTAVERLHRQGLVHIDIKPENILFSEDLSTMMLGDFSSCLPNQPITADIQPHITPEYFPIQSYNRKPEIREHPEQLDIYLIASTMFYVIERKFLPEQNNIPWNHTPQWLQKAIIKARNFRYTSIAEFRKDLDSFFQGRTQQERTQKPSLLNPAPRRMIGASIVLLNIGVLIASYIRYVGIERVLDLGGSSLVGAPLLVALLSIVQLGLGSFATLTIQAYLIAQQAPALGLLYFALALALGATAWLTHGRWLLLTMMLVPLVPQIAVLLPAIAWLLKPSQVQATPWPVAAISLGLPLHFCYLMAGCPGLSALCIDAPSLTTVAATQSLWGPALFETGPRELLTVFVSHLRSFYPVWPLVTWLLVELSSSIAEITSEPRQWNPFRRFAISALLVALTLISLAGVAIIAARLNVRAVMEELWRALEPSSSWIVLALLLLSFLVNPDQEVCLRCHAAQAGDIKVKPYAPIATIISVISILILLVFLPSIWQAARMYLLTSGMS